MSARSKDQKTECLNPNTGGSLHIDNEVYLLFSNAIREALKSGRPLTYSEIEAAVNDQFKKQKTGFKGSVGWYTVTVKNDMQARGIIEAFIEKGKKLNRLKKEGPQ